MTSRRPLLVDPYRGILFGVLLALVLWGALAAVVAVIW